jgi:hypothetical protein
MSFDKTVKNACKPKKDVPKAKVSSVSERASERLCESVERRASGLRGSRRLIGWDGWVGTDRVGFFVFLITLWGLGGCTCG